MYNTEYSNLDAIVFPCTIDPCELSSISFHFHISTNIMIEKRNINTSQIRIMITELRAREKKDNCKKKKRQL